MIDGRVFGPSDLQAVIDARGLPALAETLKKARGFFAVVAHDGRHAVAAVDHVRSYPLFYGETPQAVAVGNDASAVAAELGDSARSPQAVEEYLATSGFVMGRQTLLAGVFQLQAGELLYVDAGPDGGLRRDRYFVFEPRPESRTERLSDEELARTHNDRLEEAFQRLWLAARGRPLIVSLSGGYDSRLIALMLKESGLTRVRAITYGKPSSREVVAAAEVAGRLGLDWTHVEYSNELWRALFVQNAGLADFFAFASNSSSVPHFQDLLAVMTLRRQGDVPDDAWFVPGHTGDFTSGGHISPGMLDESTSARDRIVSEVIKKHFGLLPTYASFRPTCVQYGPRILDLADAAAATSTTDVVAACERLNWQERQAKYIMNSVRTYEYCGYGWWTPLWDQDLAAFWETVPLDQRYQQRFYFADGARRYRKAVGGDPQTTVPVPRNWVAEFLRQTAKQVHLYPFVQHAARHVRRYTERDDNPLALYGFLTKEEFARYYDARGIRGLSARITLGSLPISAMAGWRPPSSID